MANKQESREKKKNRPLTCRRLCQFDSWRRARWENKKNLIILCSINARGNREVFSECSNDQTNEARRAQKKKIFGVRILFAFWLFRHVNVIRFDLWKWNRICGGFDCIINALTISRAIETKSAMTWARRKTCFSIQFLFFSFSHSRFLLTSTLQNIFRLFSSTNEFRQKKNWRIFSRPPPKNANIWLKMCKLLIEMSNSSSADNNLFLSAKWTSAVSAADSQSNWKIVRKIDRRKTGKVSDIRLFFSHCWTTEKKWFIRNVHSRISSLAIRCFFLRSTRSFTRTKNDKNWIKLDRNSVDFRIHFQSVESQKCIFTDTRQESRIELIE